MGENVTKSSNCSDFGNLKVANDGKGGCLGVLVVDDSVVSDERDKLGEDCRAIEYKEFSGNMLPIEKLLILFCINLVCFVGLCSISS